VELVVVVVKQRIETVFAMSTSSTATGLSCSFPVASTLARLFAAQEHVWPLTTPIVQFCAGYVTEFAGLPGNVAPLSSVVIGPVAVPVAGSGHVNVTVVSVTSQAAGSVPFRTVEVNGTTVPQITFESAGGNPRSTWRLFT